MGSQAPNPPLPLPGFLVPPPTPPGPSCREQSLGPGDARPEQSRRAGQNAQQEWSALRGHRQCPEVGLSGVVQPPVTVWWHLGTGPRQATSPSGNANRSAECELVRGGRKRRAWEPTCLFPGAGSSRRSSRGDPNRRPQPSQAPGEPEGGQAVLGGRRPDSRPASPAEACPGLLPRELLFAMSTLTPSEQPQGGACAVLSKEPLGCV